MLRRLAIVFLFLVTILMAALGWILGRPGVLRPEPSPALAAPPADHATAPGGTGSSAGGGASSMGVHAGHGDARGE